MQKEYIPLSLALERNLYRQITTLSYSQNKPVSEIINRMLSDYADLAKLQKMGYVLINKNTLKTLFEQLDEKAVIESTSKISDIIEEFVLLLGKTPSFDAYVDSFRFLMKVNGYHFEATRKNNSITMIMGFGMGRQYSLYIAECLKIMFNKVATIEEIQTTDSVVFFTCTQKQDLPVNQSKIPTIS